MVARIPTGSDRTIQRGNGTSESIWLDWLQRQRFASGMQWLKESPRLVVVAPHPDDEILAAGGLMTLAARSGKPISILAVTDGTASHPCSKRWTPRRLARERPLETQRALRRLGVAAEVHRLGFEDGGVASCAAGLVVQLSEYLEATDVIVTTWRYDGHPDHDATGSACATAAARCGARLIEAPVWAWHWATPDDARVPWHRMRQIDLDDDAARRKTRALAAFRSQLAPDDAGQGPVLRPSIVERAARRFETFIIAEAPRATDAEASAHAEAPRIRR